VFALSDVPIAPQLPVLCYVTDRRTLSPTASLTETSTFIRKIEAVISAGIDWVQIREKDLSARDLSALTQQVLKIAARQPAGKHPSPRIIVNDRLDVALTEQAGGVHLGENSLPVKDAKHLATARQLRHDFLVGASCHSLESAKATVDDGADYLLFGPIFATPSKAALGAPQGVDRLAAVCSQIKIPVLAIGGITQDNLLLCLQAGAAGIAAIRLFQDTPDPAATIRLLREKLRTGS
jgi:thiamine-phosphate pyrophosphorylase